MVNYREWLVKAEEFLEEAKDDLGRGRFWLACFHAQQAVELFLKGVLISRVGTYPFTHSLVELLETLEGLGLKVPEEMYTLAESLERHYTRARYPGVGLTVYNDRVAKRCLNYAERIISFVKEVLKV